ncbi:unnamed protein product [Staurois parvus]|uniref:Uncharacterized protein n=1 Tax=Staurois parvus TaxID=386267 RepID=A0ABN9GDQ2_9NEOB|nr:unnamed protein product [Staurois parvus]
MSATLRAGRIKRVLTFGAAAREEGGERAPGTQKTLLQGSAGT